jgi:ethanolamine ammonia-lyase small subunit
MIKARPDPWMHLKAWTPARIALGRAGVALPTRAVLDFALAHARARDAVHAALDVERIAVELEALGLEAISVESDAADRATFLRRPDYGRRLAKTSRALLEKRKHTKVDIALVIGDGLSAIAVQAHAVPLIAALQPHVEARGWSLAPIVVARGARVALGDEIGRLSRARLVAMLIGERPGLSSPDSLGVYLTFAPKPGRTDAERNCLSNIRPEGLAPARAAAKLAWLIGAALDRSLTGVGLKDESDTLIGAETPSPNLTASS